MTDAVYVYAITRAQTVFSDTLRGIDGAPVSRIDAGELAAIASSLADGRLQATAGHVLQHEHVIETVRRAAPALPARFGTVIRDEKSVASLLTEHAPTLQADLDRIGWAVEMGLSIVGDAGSHLEPVAPVAASGPGGRYMNSRLAAYRQVERSRSQAEAVGEQVQAALAPFARDIRLDILPRERLALRAAFLLDNDALPAFRAAAERLRSSAGLGQMLLSGPWPPYSFVTPLHPDRRAVVDELLRQVQGLLTKSHGSVTNGLREE